MPTLPELAVKIVGDDAELLKMLQESEGAFAGLSRSLADVAGRMTAEFGQMAAAGNRDTSAIVAQMAQVREAAARTLAEETKLGHEYSASAATARKAIAEIDGAMRRQGPEQQRLARLKEIEAELKRLGPAAQDAARRNESGARQATQAFEGLKRELDEIITAEHKLGSEADATARKLREEAEAAARGVRGGGQGRLDQARDRADRLSNAGQALTAGLTVPIVGAAAGGIKFAVDYESAMNRVKKTTGAAAEEIATMGDDFKRFSENFGVEGGTDTLAGIAENAGQLGIQNAHLTEFTESVAKLGVAIDSLTPEEAATDLAQFANVAGTAQTKFSNLGSALVDLGNNGASTEKQIMEMSLRLVGAGTQIGLTEGQIMGMANALASVGIDAEAGGSALSKVMSQIAADVASGGKELGNFAKVAGMSTKDFQKLFKEDAASAIVAFVGGLGRIKQAGGDVFGTLSKLGIDEVRTRDALLRASAAGDLLAESMRRGSTAFQQNTALNAEAEAANKSTAASMEQLKNLAKNVAAEFGTALLPMFRGLIDLAKGVLGPIRSMIAGFSEMPAPLKYIAVGIGGVLAAVGPTLMVLGSLSKAFLAVRAAAIAAGLANVTFEASLGPIGIVMLTLGGLAAAFYGVGQAARKEAEDARFAAEQTQIAADMFRASLASMDATTLQYGIDYRMRALPKIVDAQAQNNAELAAARARLKQIEGRLTEDPEDDARYRRAADDVVRLERQQAALNEQFERNRREFREMSAHQNEANAPPAPAFTPPALDGNERKHHEKTPAQQALEDVRELISEYSAVHDAGLDWTKQLGAVQSKYADLLALVQQITASGRQVPREYAEAVSALQRAISENVQERFDEVTRHMSQQVVVRVRAEPFEATHVPTFEANITGRMDWVNVDAAAMEAAKQAASGLNKELVLGKTAAGELAKHGSMFAQSMDLGESALSSLADLAHSIGGVFRGISGSMERVADHLQRAAEFAKSLRTLDAERKAFNKDREANGGVTIAGLANLVPAIGGAVSSAVSFLGGIFGHHETEGDRIRKENNERLRELAAEMRDFTRSMAGRSAIADVALKLGGDKGADMFAATHFFGSRYKDGNLVGGGADRINSELQAAGLSFADLIAAAKEQGIELLDSKGHIVAGALEALGQAVEMSLGKLMHFGTGLDDWTKRLNLQARLDGVDVTKPAEQLREQLAAFAQTAPDLAKAFGLDDIDATTAEGREALKVALKKLFDAIGSIDPHLMGGLTGGADQLEGFIGSTLDALDGFTKGVNGATSALLNIPQGVKIAQMRFDATEVAQAGSVDAPPIDLGPLAKDPLRHVADAFTAPATSATKLADALDGLRSSVMDFGVGAGTPSFSGGGGKTEVTFAPTYVLQPPAGMATDDKEEWLRLAGAQARRDMNTWRGRLRSRGEEGRQLYAILPEFN